MKLLLKILIASNFWILYSCGDVNEKSIEESGIIETRNSIISSQVMGRVDAVSKDDGDFVRKGDTVVILDRENYYLLMKQTEAQKIIAQAQLDLSITGARNEDIHLAEQNLRRAELSYESAKKDKERYSKLFDQQVITRKQLDDAITMFDLAASKLSSAEENFKKIKNISRLEEIKQIRANYARAEAAFNLAKKSLHDCYITAPYDGFIVKNFVEQGETISMLSSVFKISDISLAELVVYVSEEDLGKVKLGQEAEIKTDSYKDKSYIGKVTYISPEAEFTPKNIQTKDERTKLVFAVKIAIPNPDFELKAGMPADARIRLSDYQN